MLWHIAPIISHRSQRENYQKKGSSIQLTIKLVGLKSNSLSFMRQVSKDIIISPQSQGLRGSPSPAVVRAGGNLVGRGIANPMSERTRGFEILSSLRCFGLPEKEDRAKFPLPALLL